MSSPATEHTLTVTSIEDSDITEVARNPSRLMALEGRFAENYPTRRVRIVSQLVWPGRTQDEFLSCIQHEALVNEAFVARYFQEDPAVGRHVALGDQLREIVFRCLEEKGLLRMTEEALRESLGNAIRERRKALGLTLSNMSDRTGVSLGYLSQIELGKNSASIETLYRICLALGIRMSELFTAVQRH